MSRRSSHHGGSQRDYPRTARLNQLFREIVAEALGDIDDTRLEQVTVTTVSVEPDLRHAVVLYDSLSGESGDPEVLEALAEYRWRLQGAIGRQARTRRVPELSFAPDPAVRAGARIDELLRATASTDATDATEVTDATGVALDEDDSDDSGSLPPN